MLDALSRATISSIPRRSTKTRKILIGGSGKPKILDNSTTPGTTSGHSGRIPAESNRKQTWQPSEVAEAVNQTLKTFKLTMMRFAEGKF